MHVHKHLPIHTPVLKAQVHINIILMHEPLLSSTLFSFTPSTMADRQPPSPILRRLQEHTPNSTQVVGILTLVISGGLLLLLTGLTITVAVLGLVFLTPILILTCPLWLPLLIVGVGFLSLFGSAAAAVAGVSWTYRYFRGLHPVGSDRVDFARSQIVSTVGHVKDYAREYGGYLQSKVKDAAPGA